MKTKKWYWHLIRVIHYFTYLAVIYLLNKMPRVNSFIPNGHSQKFIQDYSNKVRQNTAVYYANQFIIFLVVLIIFLFINTAQLLFKINIYSSANITNSALILFGASFGGVALGYKLIDTKLINPYVADQFRSLKYSQKIVYLFLTIMIVLAILLLFSLSFLFLFQ